MREQVDGLDEHRAPEVDELEEGEPKRVVVANALRKARAVEGVLVLGVDTAVSVGERVFGKPGDEVEAREFLSALSGRQHQVWSGIALVDAERERIGAACTRVRFRKLGAAELDWYLATEDLGP